MEVKTILSKIRQKEDQKSEYYFALEIGLEFIKSAIFSIEEKQIKVLSYGDKERWQDREELIEAVDASLSSAAEKLPIEGEVKEPDKVVFGLPFNWIEGDKIIDEKLKLLKKLSEKLSLKPTGFVVVTEAVVHHLKSTEGVPPTAILVNLGLKKITVALTRVGKISGPKLIDRSDNLADDLIEGLSRFESQEPLPARILLYDSDDKLEEAKQQLINYPWLEKKKETVEFLHLPKIETLSFNFDIESIALAGGKEVAKATGLVVEERLSEEKREVGEKKERREKRKEERGKKTEDFASAEELGFVQGKDIIEETKETSEEELEKTKPVESKSIPDWKETVSQEPSERKISPLVAKTGIFSKLSFLRSPFSWLKKINLTSFKKIISNLRQTRLVLILIIGFFLILAGGLFAAYWHYPQAEIILFLEPEVLEKDFTVILDPEADSLDKEAFVLPAQQIEVEVEGTRSRGTTGAKDVGEPAKGEATVYNGTSNEKTFDLGVVIASSGGLEFTLDDEVTIASQSSAADPPGKANVKVTAVEIGNEGNLAAATEFTIANYAKSDYVAKNESAFSGGTLRQIQAVSEEDQEVLLADLKTSLEEEAKNRLASELSLEEKLIEESIISKLVDKDYSHQVGDEVDTLELVLKLKSAALIFTEQQLRDLIEDKMAESVADGFEYRPEETKFSFDLGEVKKDGRVTFEIHLEAKLVPQLDLEQIKRNIVGKQIAIGRSYLNNLSQVAGFEVKISPQLPGRLGTFPRVAKRIEIKAEVQ
jgi:hypothetical protein